MLNLGLVHNSCRNSTLHWSRILGLPVPSEQLDTLLQSGLHARGLWNAACLLQALPHHKLVIESQWRQLGDWKPPRSGCIVCCLHYSRTSLYRSPV